MSGAENNTDKLKNESTDEAAPKYPHSSSYKKEHLRTSFSSAGDIETHETSPESGLFSSLTDEHIDLHVDIKENTDKNTRKHATSPSMSSIGRLNAHTSNLNLLQIQLMALTLSAATAGNCDPENTEAASAPPTYRSRTDIPSRRKMHENERNKNRHTHTHTHATSNGRSKQQKSKIFIKCPKK